MHFPLVAKADLMCLWTEKMVFQWEWGEEVQDPSQSYHPPVNSTGTGANQTEIQVTPIWQQKKKNLIYSQI